MDKEKKNEPERFLYEELRQYGTSDAYPFHMPGHKRNMDIMRMLLGTESDKGMPYQIDITEIDGFDNLHHAEGILLEAQKRAAELYGAEESFYLINGSTCGILAAVFACTTQRGKILMARNCHKAVYHAVELRELQTEYLYPKLYDSEDPIWCTEAQINGQICPEEVEAFLKKEKNIQAVVITSPTYDGIVSDVKAIAQTAHRYGVPLIVDEAHGAHFGFHPYFPENSVKLGADLVIHSLHKTLPSLTQTALLHVGKTIVPLREQVKKYLDIFETSSPSYVFMAGMDQCVRLIREQGNQLFEAYAKNLQRFRKETKSLPHIHVLSVPPSGQMDPGKLVIAADGLNGQQMADRLRKEEHLEVEMAAAGYVIALTSIADTWEGFDRLKKALVHISQTLSTENVEMYASEKKEVYGYQKLRQVLTISEAAGRMGISRNLADCVGEVCAEYIYLYPPGIPLAVPGEQMTKQLTEQIQEIQKKGLEIQGIRDYTGRQFRVLASEKGTAGSHG